MKFKKPLVILLRKIDPIYKGTFFIVAVLAGYIQISILADLSPNTIPYIKTFPYKRKKFWICELSGKTENCHLSFKFIISTHLFRILRRKKQLYNKSYWYMWVKIWGGGSSKKFLKENWISWTFLSMLFLFVLLGGAEKWVQGRLCWF